MRETNRVAEVHVIWSLESLDKPFSRYQTKTTWDETLVTFFNFGDMIFFLDAKRFVYVSHTSSIGHPPLSSASPVKLRLRVGPHTLSEKKKN